MMKKRIMHHIHLVFQVMYKNIDGANNALEEPVKEVEGRQVRCNLAAEGALNSGSKDKNANSAVTGAATSDGQNRKVFFKSLDFSTSYDTVRSLCSAYGEVEHIQMKIDAAGRSNGMATVTFGTAGAASDCVRLCPREIEGRRVQIQFSNPPIQQQSSTQPQYVYNPYGSMINQSIASTMLNPVAALNPAMMSAAMTTLPPQQQQQIQQQFLQQQQQYQQQQQLPQSATRR